MKITFDHNCVIALEGRTDVRRQIQRIVEDKQYNCFVLNVGASEFPKDGVRPDRYDNFDKLLHRLGIGHLPRLNPIGVVGVTFIGRCIVGDDEMDSLRDEIRSVLFGTGQRLHVADIEVGSRKWLNRECDVLGMWCHIHYGNDVFLTSDKNFIRKTKKAQLVKLGAGRICSPSEL
jgi:hypothetical protein